VQDAHERPDHCLLADDGQDLFTDTSMVFANCQHVGVVVFVGEVNGLRCSGWQYFTSLYG
jgi:hypothetical protein